MSDEKTYDLLEKAARDGSSNVRIDTGGPVTEQKSLQENLNSIIKESFKAEQESKPTYRKVLTIILVIMLIFQLLVVSFIMIYMSIKTVNYAQEVVTDTRIRLLSDYYSFLKYFITITLGEFVSAFYFILKWGFDTSLSKTVTTLSKKKTK